MEVYFDDQEFGSFNPEAEQLGLPDVSPDKLMKAATRVCIESESIHHEVGDITPEMVAHALLAADGEGRRRKEITG